MLFFALFPQIYVMAYNLDLSVNNEIQSKYDADKLNQDVQSSSPEQIIKNTKTKNVNVSKSSSVPSSAPVFDNDNPQITASNGNYKRNGIFIPKWTSFKVKSNQKISDSMNVNTFVSFTVTEPVHKKFITVQSGTVFHGIVSSVHKPQPTGNGGLVEINITSMTYNGQTYPANGKIIKANSELIFFNKIKGDRQYITGVKNKIKKAGNFYSKARQISNKLSSNPLGTVISPLPTLTGFVGGTAGTIMSPLTGLIEKGQNVSFPSGTSFEIRILNNIYVN